MRRTFLTRTGLLAVVTALLMAVHMSASAEVYRWVDENGRVHYSDKPVSDKAKTVDIKTGPAPAPATNDGLDRKSRTEQYLRARELERAEIDRKQKEKKRLKAERKTKCAAAKKEYKRQVTALALYYKNKDGSRKYLEDDERQKSQAAAKAEIKKWCK